MIIDEQFKIFMQHNIIILKHNMRNLDEKVTSLVEMINKNDSYINNNTKDTVMIDYSYIVCLFPITNKSILNDIEEQLSKDKKYNTELVN